MALEPEFQQRAVDNMRAGQLKVWQVPEAQHIDVRKEIACAAGVGGRNVRTILKVAHPRLIEAPRNGTLTINRAIQFCELPRRAQLEPFIRYSEERAINRVKPAQSWARHRVFLVS